MRCPRVPAILASAALAVSLLSAQTGTKPPSGTSGSTGTGSSGLNTPPMSSTPNAPANSTTSNSPLNRPGEYFFGNVVMEDGTVPPMGAVIERVCNGGARPMAYVDSRGNFSFQTNNTQDMLPDASLDKPSAGTPNLGGLASVSKNPSVVNPSANPLYGCDLRASLPGYRSELISLAGRRSLDDPNVGTFTLHPMSKVEGLTTSATSALAPKDAQKAYAKGVEAAKKAKFDDALANFQKATSLYDRYAVAWLDMGHVYEDSYRPKDAREAYAKSIAADPKFVYPYERMYILDVNDKKWADVAATTDKIKHLNPYDFPMAVYYNAVANLELGKLDIAEKGIREAAAMDTAGKNPKINYVLGVILAKKGDFKASAEYLRIYMKSDAITDREGVKKLLDQVEKQVQAKAGAEPKP